ncbi:MAG TPA: YvcK family protein [Fimbriimonadales bacterium]|nr:YvcK family protein [Fimbriimonadales bacterium]
MKKPHKIRRWLGSGATIRRALYFFVPGLAFIILGLAFSFRLLILPSLEQLDAFGTRIIRSLVPPNYVPDVKHYTAGALLILGGYLCYRAVTYFVREILRYMNPGSDSKIFGTYFRKRLLASGPNLVALGGGTGLSTILRGIKTRTSNITAIVTVTDDGGSSGRLITDKGILPPGDIRNCLVALADAEKSMTDIFQHRFEAGSGTLSGHSLGNLLIAAMVDITGDFEKAVGEISKVLAIRGRVLPATRDRVRLRALMENGMEICGETKIVHSGLRIRRIFLDPEDVQPLEEALDAITEADMIVIGPGSIYTSVIPPLLVPGIAETIAESDAIKVYICNVMTQPGESDGFTASDHVHAIEANIGRRVFDYVLVNKTPPSSNLLSRYSEAGQDFVEPDIDRIRAMGLRVIKGNYISESDVVRHDPLRITDSLMRLVE